MQKTALEVCVCSISSPAQYQIQLVSPSLPVCGARKSELSLSRAIAPSRPVLMQRQQESTKQLSAHQQQSGIEASNPALPGPSISQRFPTCSFAESMFVHPPALRLCTNSTQRSDVEGPGLRQRPVLILPQS